MTATSEQTVKMSKFPEALKVPFEVADARRARYKSVVGSSKRGIAVRTFIAAVELTAGLYFGSSSLFMDALSTSLDIATSLILVLSFRLAARPPDTNHPFGHGRYEPLAGLQLGFFLLVLGAGMLFYNSSEIAHFDPHVHLHPALWIIPACAALMLESCYRVMSRTAKRENSPALLADAVHYRIDALTSILAASALLLGSLFPSLNQIYDHLGASLISLIMVVVGFNAARNNLHQLLDHVPQPEYFEKVKRAALRANGVLATEKIRIQLYGPDAHVDIDVEVEPLLSVEKAHAISQVVRWEIQKEIPEVQDVIVHIEPYYPGDH